MNTDRHGFKQEVHDNHLLGRPSVQISVQLWLKERAVQKERDRPEKDGLLKCETEPNGNAYRILSRRDAN